MRPWIPLYVLLTVIAWPAVDGQSTSASPAAADVRAAEMPLHTWVRLLNAGRWDSLASQTTQDFRIIKGTEELTVPELVRRARAQAMVTITARLDSVHTSVAGDIAYSKYRARVGFRMNDVEGAVDEIGALVLRQENGMWKLSFWHLTQLPAKSP